MASSGDKAIPPASSRTTIVEPPNPIVVNKKPGLLAEDYQLSSIDVLCGRGKGTRMHDGNKRYTKIIEDNLKRYSDASKKIQKSYIVASIVDALRESGTHFLKKDMPTGRWYDIGDIQAREKTGHAIRDYLVKMTKARIGTEISSSLLQIEGGKHTLTTSHHTSSSIPDPVLSVAVKPVPLEISIPASPRDEGEIESLVAHATSDEHMAEESLHMIEPFCHLGTTTEESDMMPQDLLDNFDLDWLLASDLPHDERDTNLK